MITAVTHAPHTYTSAYGPIVWTVKSDFSSVTSTWKYVFDVYLVGPTSGNDIYVGRTKVPPNPAGYGSIDVQTMVQPYTLDYLNSTSEWFEVMKVQGSTAIFNEPVVISGTAGDYRGVLVNGIRVLVGEEQNGQIFDGKGGTTGTPGFSLNSRGATQQGDTSLLHFVRAFASAQNTIEATSNDLVGLSGSATHSVHYGTWSPYVMGTASGEGKFLTSGLTQHALRYRDQHTLTFVNRDIQTGFGSPMWMGYNYSWTIGATSYNSGTQIKTVWTDFGAGPRNDVSDIGTGATAFASPSQEICIASVGPETFGLGPTFTGLTYTVTLIGSNGVAGGARLSDAHDFTVNDDCPNCFPSIRFSWLNRQGGRDYFNFDKYYELSYDAKSNTYFRDPNQWSGSAWSLKPWSAGTITYNKEINRSVRVMSDWLNETQKEHLKGLFESPHVFVYLPDETYPQTCIVRENTFVMSHKFAKKMYNLEFRFDLSFNDRVQTQ